MPGEWIKMRVELHESPKVGKIARLTGLDRFAVIGRLHKLWGWVDQVSEYGDNIDAENADIDELVGFDGFSDALRTCGWLSGDAGCLTFTNFSEHNGYTARRRAEDARRKGRVRKMSAAVRTDVRSSVELEEEPEEEKEREPEEEKHKDTHARETPESEAAFEAWWKSYPIRPGAKTRGNKGAARKAWAKLKPAEWPQIDLATQRLCESGRYPQDAERFIRPPRGGGDCPYVSLLEDVTDAPVAGAKKTVAQSREEGNYDYDDSWLRKLDQEADARRSARLLAEKGSPNGHRTNGAVSSGPVP